AGVFAGIDYVALGHLHSPQQISGPAGTVLRYSGSPLAYSFSERTVPKSTVLVELDEAGVRTTLVPAPVPRRLSEVTGPLDELLGAGGEPYLEDWLKVTVTDAARPPDLYRRVRERFAHALVVQHQPVGASTVARAAAVNEATDPLLVAADFVAHVTGARPDAAESAVLARAYEDVLAASAGA
ncbi:MAG: exonuclease SbcCD subunit D C-terminal domain-containing protein, partial [Actinobacteria bacterium]|nr:exonuclease SbcCD subunit D C-terminal domain-containing protein [Actinomycetota bacterium]